MEATLITSVSSSCMAQADHAQPHKQMPGQPACDKLSMQNLELGARPPSTNLRLEVNLKKTSVVHGNAEYLCYIHVMVR